MIKVEFLTQDDPLYIFPFFEELFRCYLKEFTVLRVSACQIMGSRPRLQMARELAALYGIPGFARLLGRVAVGKAFHWIPAPPSRSKTLAQLCRAHGIPYQTIGNPNEDAFVAEFAARGADLLISVACPYILKTRLISQAPLGSINIHHAPLPRYQGMMPTFWQLYEGARNVGVTIHYMASKVDQGEAILRDELPVEPGETLDHLIRRSKRHGAHCMGRVIRRFAAEGRVPPLPPGEADPSYFTFPTLQEIEEFHRRGFRGI